MQSYQSRNLSNNKMNLQDFARMEIYKMFLPTLYIISWILMFSGLPYFPHFYQKYYIFCVFYLTFRTTFSCIWTQIGAAKAHQLMDKIQNSRAQQKRKVIKQQEISKKYLQKHWVEHIFVIPNYNQQEEVLSQTLQILCSHRQAKQRYSVFLAMENHQKDAQIKAQRLINKFKSKLKHIDHTLHELKKYQQRGKAANVSWCVQHLEYIYLNPNNIDLKQVLLTIIDADSLVPEQYMIEVQNYIDLHSQKLHSFIFQPCQMFTRNQHQVPFVVRYYDIAHGLVHFSNLFSFFGTSFPLSNYSLSYTLIKKIGFWDTCPDAIGQDFHTTIKAFWKTQGKVTTVPIFTPFNQLSIHTGKGFWADVCQRFWQAERHGRGCADAAYNLKRLIQTRVNWRTFLIAFQSLQITIIPAFLPWCLTSIGLTRLYNNMIGSQLVFNNDLNTYDVSWLFNICTLASVWMFVQYDSVCRRASSIYYKQTTKNLIYQSFQWIWRLVSYNLVFFVCIFTITIPSVTIAVFRIVFGQNVYQAAEKKLDLKQKHLKLEK